MKIEDGQAFFAHETSANITPMEIILDFKNITPRMDPRSGKDPIMVLRHNPVVLAPAHAKNLAELLNKIVKKYEKEFGKISVPKAVKNFEKKQKTKRPKKSNTVTPTYFG